MYSVAFSVIKQVVLSDIMTLSKCEGSPELDYSKEEMIDQSLLTSIKWLLGYPFRQQVTTEITSF